MNVKTFFLKTLSFGFIILSFLPVQSQELTNEADYLFAISLQPSTQDIITFALVKYNANGEVVDRIFLKRYDWVRQIVGIQQSKANPEGKNLMKEAGIEGPEVIDELWKLRYAEWPYEGSKEKGWAAKPRIPSEGQMQMLSRFGLNTLNDYIVGEKLLQLLKAMEDPGWVSEYQNK